MQKTFTNSLNNLKIWHEIFQKCCGIIFSNITVNLSEIFHRKISEMFLCPHHFSFSNISWYMSAKFLQNLYEMFLKYCRSLSQSICIIHQLAMKYFSKISWNICGTFLETFYEMFLKYCRKISKRIVHFPPLRKIHRNLPWKFSGWSKFLAESFEVRF